MDTISDRFPEIRKIKNHKKLLDRLNSAKDENQIKDIISEMQVGAHHIKKGHSVEYEPPKPNPPEFRVITNENDFFVEVKSVREHEDLENQRKIRNDLEERIQKIKKPYLLYLNVYETKFDSLKNKKIASFIKNKLDTRIEFNTDIKIEIGSEEVGYFAIEGILKDSDYCRLQKSYMFSYGDIMQKIINQIENANKKTIPVHKHFIVIIRLPDHADEYEMESAIKGIETIELFSDKVSKRVVASRTIRKNRTLYSNKHFKRICAIIYYKDEFDVKNSYYILNKNANCPLDKSFIKDNYFDCNPLDK